MSMGAALLKRRPASRELTVRAGILGALYTGRVFHFMRRVSQAEGSAGPGSCVAALARSERPRSPASRR